MRLDHESTLPVPTGREGDVPLAVDRGGPALPSVFVQVTHRGRGE